MVEETFNFSVLTALHKNKRALKFGVESYSFRELKIMVKEHSKKYVNQNKKAIIVDNTSPLGFITDFLSILYSDNYPLVSTTSIPNLHIISKDIPRDTLFLGTTSGTTGSPKIYYRNWNSWKEGFDVCEELFHLSQVDILSTPSPLTTSLGLHTLLYSLYLGKTFCNITHPEQIVDIESSYALFTVPTYIIKNKDYYLPSNKLKKLFLGGGTLDKYELRSLGTLLLDTEIIEFYGSSETSFVSWQKVNKGKALYSVGQLFPKTFAFFKGNNIICVKSPYLFSGYANQPRPVAWQTDDYGELKDDKLFMFGRVSDFINHGGNKISPLEIETAAQDLCEKCIAFGIPDKLYGERIALLMVNPIEKNSLLKLLCQRLPAYKLPQIYLKNKFIPLTINQKISRKKLQEDYLKGAYHEF